jgi:hypothetical protein
MITVVQKPFTSSGPQPLRSGAIVDSTGWRNEARLLRGRWLRPATPQEAAEHSGDRKPRGSGR